MLVLCKCRLPLSPGGKMSRRYVRSLRAAAACTWLPDISDASQIAQVLPRCLPFCLETAREEEPLELLLHPPCLCALSPAQPRAGKLDWFMLCKVLHKPLSSQCKYYASATYAHTWWGFLFFILISLMCSILGLNKAGLSFVPHSAWKWGQKKNEFLCF